ncbi:unnamed protein product [Caenorhabditis bovis]|uniref:Nanos-type domain-containing protein n=1 Tax=Caenorhabditis bovis TaxID=2654633 RepID=A0A8S1E4N9_9PELO|nr:unnamed protein product [Caenorhabditis bovis]
MHNESMADFNNNNHDENRSMGDSGASEDSRSIEEEVGIDMGEARDEPTPEPIADSPQPQLLDRTQLILSLCRSQDDWMVVRGNPRTNLLDLMYARRIAELLIRWLTTPEAISAEERVFNYQVMLSLMHRLQKFAQPLLSRRYSNRRFCCRVCYNYVKMRCQFLQVPIPPRESFGPWSTHPLMVNVRGVTMTLCPFLRCQLCPYCCATGHRAHIPKRCPFYPH